MMKFASGNIAAPQYSKVAGSAGENTPGVTVEIGGS